MAGEPQAGEDCYYRYAEWPTWKLPVVGDTPTEWDPVLPPRPRCLHGRRLSHAAVAAKMRLSKAAVSAKRRQIDLPAAWESGSSTREVSHLAPRNCAGWRCS